MKDIDGVLCGHSSATNITGAAAWGNITSLSTGEGVEINAGIDDAHQGLQKRELLWHYCECVRGGVYFGQSSSIAVTDMDRYV